VATELSRISRTAPVLLAGPTAGGKSALALRLAERDGRTIVNADALQVHAAWRLLTARPGDDDLSRAPHALYGHVPPGAPHSVGHWLAEVAPLLVRPVVIVGGTGLFFAALTKGLAVIPPVPAGIRAEADALRAGPDGIARMRAGLDPATAARIDLQNPARVQRAWEVLRATGTGLAAWQDGTAAPILPRHEAEGLVLSPPTPDLDARIAARFDAMLRAGVLEEVRANLSRLGTGAPWTRAIGAAELAAYLRGEGTLEAAARAATLATRRYAKRQRTWARARMGDWTWHSAL
jgi:tRNA dimethylallyltransferase